MEHFNPIAASKNIKDGFVDYITTTFEIADKVYAEKLREELQKDGYVAKGPFLDVSGSYKTAQSISELIESGDTSTLFRTLEPVPESERELKIERPLYTHQQEALKKANDGCNLVVTTGTGSGKTECFLIPIVNSLLREIENSKTLDDGVRAIIIYPMNALANDQIKRMRALLQYEKRITFGLYNGNTEHTEEKAIKAYKEANGKDAEPLDNEMIYRERMQKTPPHILITNYSMLEYMMLRPKDDKVFSGAKLRFIVLDEAHVYRGTTGMETAMLMRRLRARISTRDTVQYILTSATLGGTESNNAIVHFAERLCEVKFKVENIIRSQDALPRMKAELEVSNDLFSDIADEKLTISEALKKHGISDYAPNGDDREKIYELLLHCEIFKRFVECTRVPITIRELKNQLGATAPITQKQLIDFISCCTQAEKGKTSLIKARYHFFVRALEGAYITLNEPKKLFLDRREKLITGEERQSVFEVAVCLDCGRLALVGAEDKLGYFKQVARKTDANPEECEYFLIDDGTLGDVFQEEDEQFGKGTNPTDANDYVVCPVCAKLGMKGDLRFGSICDCDIDIKQYVSLKKVERTKKGTAKCSACGSGSLRAFYLGNHAATAVLGTELFEQLPDEEVTEESKAVAAEFNQQEADFDFFGTPEPIRPARSKKAKQFLCFSDSRSDAAFFANYMEKSYEEFLRRRAMLRVADQLVESGKTEDSVKAFVNRLTRFFDANKTFDVWMPERKDDPDALHLVSESNAWIAVLNELFNSRRGTSLPSLGLLSFEYKPHQKYVEGMAKGLNLTQEETKNLLDLLVMDAVWSGAVDAGKAISLQPAEREYIFFSKYEKKLVLTKNEQASKLSIGWGGRIRTQDPLTYYPNSRIQRLVKITGWDHEKADGFLKQYWKNVFGQGEAISEYVIDAGDFNLRLCGDSQLHFYRCKKCGRVTSYNVKGFCASVKCDGTLAEIGTEDLSEGNHYIKLYRAEQMQPLQIKEHTAQLSRNQQTRYQQAFVNKDINALSCSTTFEMGVDVGSLETVYMRNIPPSPANYVQRAGRAGRALHTAAYVLTYAKLSSHDMTFYHDPSKIILGKIQAPVFELENEKVIIRHIFAVALSKFFALHPEVYDGDDRRNLLNEGGYELLKEYLESKPEDLLALLKKSIPPQLHRTLGVDNYQWTEKIVGNDGVLQIAVDEYRNEVKQLEDQIKACKKEDDFSLGNRLYNVLEQLKGSRSLIDFLVRNNALPKYGFPVDTVELQVNFGRERRSGDPLQLARDLQLAIAEYAPGSEIIADGQCYKSRYIRKLPAKGRSSTWEENYYCKCPSCQEPNFSPNKLTRNMGANCISCGKKIPGPRWQLTIEPRRGFLTEGKPTPAPMRRPERDYKTADYYVGDIQRKEIDKLRFEVNGQVVELESTANDSLAVVGLTEYTVCPMCGYAIDALSEEKKAVHKTPGGYDCQNKEWKSKKMARLSHVFKTFVAKITFCTLEALDRDTMLSVMYALLEGLSRELGIERTDLKGCLHQVLWSGSNRPIFSIILYDAVAGGAGHVRRLVTKDGEAFQRVLKRAIDVVGSCTCDPSCYKCLRNYYNATVHDLLDRKKAKGFLSKWVGEYTPVDILKEGEDNAKDVEFLIQEKSAEGYASWKDFGEAYSLDALKNWDDGFIPKDCFCFPEIRVANQLLRPYFIWADKKIAVFEAGAEDNTEVLQNRGWICCFIDESPDKLKNIFVEN